MDWRITTFAVLLIPACIPLVWSELQSGVTTHKGSEISPYIDLALCPLRSQAWSCARQQSKRILDEWDNKLHTQWQKLKAEADLQLNATLEKRGYDENMPVIKEKPSTILRKIEIGTNYMKEYLAETMNGFLGHEYSFIDRPKSNSGARDMQGDEDVSNVAIADESDNENKQDDYGNIDIDDMELEKDNTAKLGNQGNGDEFIDIEDTKTETEFESDNDSTMVDENGEGDKNTQTGKKQKMKKKKGHGSGDVGTVVLVQVDPSGHGGAAAGNQWNDWSDDEKPMKMKRKKMKKRKKHQKPHVIHGSNHGGDDDSILLVEKPSSGSLLFDLVDEFADADLFDNSVGTKKKHPTNYGRSNGVTRGKKKKKKKALAKLVILGSFLKAKIELLLKLLGAHLQIKFFAIALIGLLINIARFWIDVKRGGSPQKVVYVEHAHHQHHYEDHGDDWNEQGSYWKRSLQTDPTIEADGGAYTEDSYQPRSQQPQQQPAYDAQYLAYRNQWTNIGD